MQPTRRGKLASWTLSREKVPERDQETISSTQQGRSDDPRIQRQQSDAGFQTNLRLNRLLRLDKGREVSGYVRATKQTLSSLLQRPTDMRGDLGKVKVNPEGANPYCSKMLHSW